MNYTLDKKKFLQRLAEKGHRSALDLARQSGIHRNTLNLYLKGKRVFAEAFERIAAALGVDPLELIVPASEESRGIDAVDEILPIVNLILKHDKRIAVMLLGSRAKGKKRKHADWDIGIRRLGEPIDGKEYLKLRCLVSDTADELAHGVDLVNLDQAPHWFLAGIDYEPVFLGGDREAFIHFKGVLHGIQKGEAA